MKQYINKKHVGGSFDDFLKEEGIYEEVNALAIKKVLKDQNNSQSTLNESNTTSPKTPIDKQQDFPQEVLDQISRDTEIWESRVMTGLQKMQTNPEYAEKVASKLF